MTKDYSDVPNTPPHAYSGPQSTGERQMENDERKMIIGERQNGGPLAKDERRRKICERRMAKDYSDVPITQPHAYSGPQSTGERRMTKGKRQMIIGERQKVEKHWRKTKGGGPFANDGWQKTTLMFRIRHPTLIRDLRVLVKDGWRRAKGK